MERYDRYNPMATKQRFARNDEPNWAYREQDFYKRIINKNEQPLIHQCVKMSDLEEMLQ